MSDSDFIRELLECSVCLEQLDATSRVLPCQHTFCKRCLEGIVETHKELRCPECRIVVPTEVCDLPTNILLIRLLDGLKKNPKFVPRHVRQRSNSRPAFRIDRQIFFQPSAPVPAPISLNRRESSCTRANRTQRIDFRINGTPQVVANVTCPKPTACRVQPQRRGESNSSTLPPRVVPPHDQLYSTTTQVVTAGHGPQSSSSTRLLRSQDPAPDFPAYSFCRSNSHDFLAGVQAMFGFSHPVSSSTSGRTKSLSRPSSRVSDKHSARICVSPNRLETRPTTLALSKTCCTERLKSQISASTVVGNPLYGQITHPKGEPLIGKSMAFIPSESCLSALNSQQGMPANGRRVQAIYGCVGETSGELSFEPDAIITDVQSSGEDGWLIGNYMGRRGLLPSNYVQNLDHRVAD